MCEDNRTEVTEFLLLGFQNLHKFKIFLFIMFFTSYILIVNGNLIIVVLISVNDRLHIPMFLFLKHLAMTDLMITTIIIPMMLEIIIKDGIAISVTACIVQLHGFSIFGSMQCLLLAVMSYDRYLAICNPMHYNSIMKPDVCLKIIVFSWMATILVSGEFVLVYQFHFCDGNIIDHSFCDFSPLIELSTSDASFFVSFDFAMCILGMFVPLAFITVTYVLISFTISRLSSTDGRWKAFSTCSSHLATVCTYYGSMITVYIIPSDERSINTNKFMSLFYIVATPLVNPLIYSLRNHEIRKSLTKMFRNVKTCQW